MIQNKKVSFYTLGCKLNFSETSTIGRQFAEKGYQQVDFQSNADIYVINTCSVTDNADKKCRKVVKEALKYSPNAYIVIVGCYAQLKPTEIAEIPGVDLVLGAAEKFRMLEFIDDLVKQPNAKVYNQPIEQANIFTPSYSYGDRTRTFLKIQDGCDYSCSFCTIPLARGASRSDTVANIIESAKKIAETEVKEIVLAGVNIGDYGKGEFGNKKHEHTFFELITQLDNVEGIERIRISSIEPNLLTNEILDFVSKSKRFVPHFHIPLQSGNNKILGLMRRRYKRELYLERIQQIKTLMPDACIGADVIVGFPGETREDFLDTYEFLNQLDVSYLHVFPYSERDNTPAINYEGSVPPSERSERSKMLQILSDKKRHAFYEQHIGKKMNVLFEADSKGATMNGFTSNYVKIVTNYDPLLVNEIREVTLKGFNSDGDIEITY